MGGFECSPRRGFQLDDAMRIASHPNQDCLQIRNGDMRQSKSNRWAIYFRFLQTSIRGGIHGTAWNLMDDEAGQVAATGFSEVVFILVEGCGLFGYQVHSSMRGDIHLRKSHIEDGRQGTTQCIHRTLHHHSLPTTNCGNVAAVGG